MVRSPVDESTVAVDDSKMSEVESPTVDPDMVRDDVACSSKLDVTPRSTGSVGAVTSDAEATDDAASSVEALPAGVSSGGGSVVGIWDDKPGADVVSEPNVEAAVDTSDGKLTSEEVGTSETVAAGV